VAALSDQLLVAAILAYLVAMMCYAAEYAFGDRGAVARVAAGRVRAAEASRSAELVGAGGPPVSAPLDSLLDPVPPVAGPDRRSLWAPRFGFAAVLITGLGTLLHAGCLVARGFAAHRVPWGNGYEFVIAVTLVASIAWMGLVLRRPSARPIGLIVTLVFVVLLGVDGMVFYSAVEPLVPALNSYWLKIHVTLAITASGTLLVGFAAAALYLIRAGYDKRAAEGAPIGFPFTLGERLPVGDNLERLTFRIHAFAFPIWTLAIMCGAIWAESAWGRYWGWDPKETWSFIAWVIYAGYLHARATPSVKKTTATWIAMAGWTAMIVNLFLVNLVVSGLHSYAGMK
jgi:cytochrome c-type biogenesis protein CcsB